MADFDKAFSVGEGIALGDDENVGIVSGTTDPSIAGQAAPVGSVYLRAATGGELYVKNGALDTDWVPIGAGGNGTVTSVAATAPTEGFTISGSPITTSGTLTFTLADDLAAVEGITTTGLAARTAANTWATRSIVQPVAGITVTDGNGVAGDPTLALADDLLAVESIGTTGIAARTAANTWATRTITGTTDQIALTNGAGIAGDPTISIATDPILPGTGSVTVPDGTTGERPGTPVNGMLRYNTTDNVFEGYENGAWVDFNTTVEAKQHFFGNNNSITQTFTAATTINFSTVVRSDAAFTEAADVGGTSVTINTAGWYEITYECSADSTTGTRTVAQWELELNSVFLAGSRAFSYHRNTAGGEGTADATVKVNLSATDVIRVRGSVIQGNAVTTVAEACRLNIQAIDGP